MGEKDTLNKLQHSVQFPIHPCDVQVETTLRRQAAFLSPASPTMCKAVCLQGGHEHFLGPPCSQRCRCSSLWRKAVLISSGIIPTSFAIVSLTFKMPVELRRNEHAAPKGQITAALGTCQDWGGPCFLPVLQFAGARRMLAGTLISLPRGCRGKEGSSCWVWGLSKDPFRSQVHWGLRTHSSSSTQGGCARNSC